jgi:hypothetical protein
MSFIGFDEIVLFDFSSFMMPIQIKVQMFIYHYKCDLFTNYLWPWLILNELYWI